MLQNLLSNAFNKHQIEYWGLTPLDSLLPFFENSAAKRVPSNASSVIVCLLPYFTGEHPTRNLSYYAIIPDYHNIVGEMLKGICEQLTEHYPHNSFVPFVDISPIDEVKAATLCGLGNIGPSSLLINKEYGALCFIGCIITDLAASSIIREGNEGCVHCDQCISACPAQALSPNGLDATKCLSALTQQKKELSSDQIERIRQNKLVWGCDCCSLACPIHSKPTPIREFYGQIIPCVTPQNLDTLMQNRAFAYRGKKVMLRNLKLLDE